MSHGGLSGVTRSVTELFRCASHSSTMANYVKIKNGLIGLRPRVR